MRRFRFHLGTLVIVVLLFGVSFEALRESNETWDSSIFTLTLGVLLTSILLAIHRAEKRRAFWLGFALFGLAYLALFLVPSIESRLITTKGLAFIDSKVPRSIARSEVLFDDLLVENNSQPITLTVKEGTGNLIEMPVVAGSKPLFPIILAGPSLTRSSGTTENFVRIGHSLFALLAGWLGGQLSRCLCRASRSSEPTAAVEA
jgi:hypothetical protein